MVRSSVTSNVMDNISNRLKVQSNLNGGEKVLILVNGSSIDIYNNLEKLNSLKNNGFKISLGFSFMGEKMLDTKRIINSLKPQEIFNEEDIFRLKSILNDYFIVIAPNLTINTLSKISLGMVDSLVSNIIWSFLYHDKKVYIDFNSVRSYMGEPPKSKEIEKVIKAHIDTILRMGAIEFTSGNKFEDLIPRVISSNSKITNNEHRDKRGLITEKDISKLDKDQRVLILNKGTVITPLARDKARELGLSIEIK